MTAVTPPGASLTAVGTAAILEYVLSLAARSSADRALGFEPRCRGFKSLRADQLITP